MDRKLSIISNNSKKLCTKNMGLLPSMAGVFFSASRVMGSFNIMITSGTRNITARTMVAGRAFPVRYRSAQRVRAP